MFQRKDELYTISYPQSPDLRTIGDITFQMPAMPEDRMIINWNVKTKDQKFVVRQVPGDLQFWKRDTIEEFCEAEWHRRINGYWIYINGIPEYIPPGCDVYFHYWVTETGIIPMFREEALEFFQIWYLAVRNDPDCMGLVDIKCRRLGDTEKALFIAWEEATRYKHSRCGMQHINETDAGKNFSRLVDANWTMPFWYKPLYRGTEKPTEVLSFTKQMMGFAKSSQVELNLDQIEANKMYLGSRIDYAPTRTLAYDGQLLHFYHLDEAFKMKTHRMDVRAQLSNIRKVISLNNEMKVVGKMLISSTVEDMEDGATVALAAQLWEQSDPRVRNENNRTASGLYRIFRPFTLAAQVDEYGRHKKKEAIKFRDIQIRTALEAQDYKEYNSIRRKQPETIEDALSEPDGDYPLHPELCEARLIQLRNQVDKHDNPQPTKVVIGDLRWRHNKQFGEVEFVPNPKGLWHISQMPKHPNKKITRPYGKYKVAPSCDHIYDIGIDPYDADETVLKGSDGAIVVRMRFLPEFENPELMYDEEGQPINRSEMWTNQIVCDYKHRPKNPYVFYEHCLMTILFYSARACIERDKPGVISWIRNKTPFGEYLSLDEKGNAGIKAQTDVINRYTELLSSYIYTQIWCTHHPRVVAQWKIFTKAKRTKYDLAVASGMCEIQNDIKGEVAPPEHKKQDAWSAATVFERG